MSMPFLDPTEPFTFQLESDLAPLEGQRVRRRSLPTKEETAIADDTSLIIQDRFILGIETNDYHLSGSSHILELEETITNDDTIFQTSLITVNYVDPCLMEAP